MISDEEDENLSDQMKLALLVREYILKNRINYETFVKDIIFKNTNNYIALLANILRKSPDEIIKSVNMILRTENKLHDDLEPPKVTLTDITR